MLSKKTDIEIIDLVLTGNQGAYADLVKTHQRYVLL